MTIDDQSSVYVGGLPFDADEHAVRKVFEDHGEVLAVKIVEDHAGSSRGYGFVTFTTPENASRAISELNGQSIGGRTIKVNEVRNGKGGYKASLRDNSSRNRDRDDRRDSWRDHADDSRDRHRDGRSRYYSPRHSSRRSPGRSNRNYSPHRPRDRSRSRSVTRGSAGHYDDAPRSRVSSEMTGDNVKLRDGLAKLQDRKEQVAALQTQVDHSNNALGEMKDRTKTLENEVERSRGINDRYAEHLKRMQRLRLEIRECKQKLASLEKDYEGLVEAGVQLENTDTGHYDRRPTANGHADERKGFEPQ